MDACAECGKKATIEVGTTGVGLCDYCASDSAVVERMSAAFGLEAGQAIAKPWSGIVLTTEVGPQLNVVERLDVITAECVFGMNAFRDFFAGVRDVFGGRSEATQKVLRDARIQVLDELRMEAHRIGANAVVGVDLDYSEFSGQGKSMLFIVASGTAVVVE